MGNVITAYTEFQTHLSGVCEKLRAAGLSETQIEEFSKRWLQQASLAELEDTVNQLDLLEKGISSGSVGTTEVFDEIMQLMNLIGQIAERPEVGAVFTSEEQASSTSPRDPDIEVSLADAGGQIGPILRRVSYAMADAGVDDEVIDQYKDEVRSTGDPIGVGRRWMRVT